MKTTPQNDVNIFVSFGLIFPSTFFLVYILDPSMNSTQRITILKKKIQDLRKTYIMIKTELASIDRRRKKLRRREREMKKNVQKQLQQQQQNQQILVQIDENHPSIM